MIANWSWSQPYLMSKQPIRAQPTDSGETSGHWNATRNSILQTSPFCVHAGYSKYSWSKIKWQLSCEGTLSWPRMVTHKLHNVLTIFLPAKITQFQHSRFWIKKQILWFDVTVANTNRVNVSQGTKHLVHVELIQKHIKKRLRFKFTEESSKGRFACHTGGSGVYCLNKCLLSKKLVTLKQFCLAYLNIQYGYGLFCFTVVSCYSINSLRNKIKNQI